MLRKQEEEESGANLQVLQLKCLGPQQTPKKLPQGFESKL